MYNEQLTINNEESEFEKLGVNSELIEKLKTRYIVKPTRIQELVIPKLLEGKSVVFRSATGTGKTFAYLLPVIQCTMHNAQCTINNNPKILICVPTLELCSQIDNEIKFLIQKPSTFNLLPSTCITGTPGKLLSLAKAGKLKLKDLHTLILDEADRLAAKDCLEDTQKLLALILKTAPNVQVAACSATVSKKSCEKLGDLFKDAELIKSDDNEILREHIEHWAIFSEKRKKTNTLRSLIAAINNRTGKSKKSKIKILVFTSKNDDAALIHSKLLHHKVPAAALFGKLEKKPFSLEQRQTELDSFKSGKAQILVATDLACRGLDIRFITHVVALDVPGSAELYIHRAGRTGRAGKRGIMVTIGCETQMRLLVSLEKKLKIRIIPKVLYGGRILDVDFLN